MKKIYLIVSIILASFVMSIFASLITASPAYAKNQFLGDCKNQDNKYYTKSVQIDPNSAYVGDTVRFTVKIAVYNGYSFVKWPGWNTVTLTQGTRTVPSWKWGFPPGGFNLSVDTGRILMKSDTTGDTCWVNNKTITGTGWYAPPQPTAVNYTTNYNSGRWDTDVTVNFRVTHMVNGSTYKLNGTVNFYYYGKDYLIPEQAPISNGYGSITIPRSHVVFTVCNRNWQPSAPWDMILKNSLVSCDSTWFLGSNMYKTGWIDALIGVKPGQINLTYATKYMSGLNGIAGIAFTPNEPLRWLPSLNAIPHGFVIDTPGTDSQTWGGANGAPGLTGVSRAGEDSRNLQRLDKACAQSATSTTLCNGWKPYEGKKYGSGAYAWYALRINNFANQTAYYINCEPEGGGRVKFKYYDYGQGAYNASFYDNTLMTHKQQGIRFNLEPPAMSSLTPSATGILGGFEGGSSPDRWDILKPARDTGSFWPVVITGGFTSVFSLTPDGFNRYQNWGNYTGELGNASCVYPYASAWLPSTTTLSLPSSQIVNGQYLFSTAMPVRLGSLDVRGGSGADNRTLPATPVRIELRGPENVNVSVYCLSGGNSSACINQAVRTMRVPGDYTIRACWTGGVVGGGVHRIFTGSCSNTVSFKVYETFACTFPEDAANNITIGPDAQGQTITGNSGGSPKIVRSGDKIRVTYPNVTTNNFKGLVSVPAPPAGNPQIKGRTRIVAGSNPFESSDVRLYKVSGGSTVEINSNRGSSLEWNDGIETANPVHYISYYWPSAQTASGRASIQIERRIWIWAQAFDPRQPATSPPVTQWWSCDTSDSPHSAWIQIINSQLDK